MQIQEKDVDHSQDELEKSVGVFFNQLLWHRQGESILLYVDQGSDDRVANTLKAHAEKRGGCTEIFALNSDQTLANQAKQLAEKIKHGSFNIICELSEQYFYLTSAWKAARQAGARVYSLAGLNTASFVRCVGNVNHTRMFEFGMELKKVLQESRRIRIYTQNGTDIRMQLGMNVFKRLIARLRKRPRSFILTPCGILNDEIQTTFLGGQISFLGVRKTIKGTAVIDGYLWPPVEIGRLDQPIVVRFDEGKVVDIGGNPEKSKILTKWFKGQTNWVEHFSIGFNPGARLSGKILEVERFFGCMVVGLGRGYSHTDGVIVDPSIEVDDNLIEEKGAFISEKLLPLKQEMVQGEQSMSHYCGEH